jgi:hypothetical protein
MGEGQQFELVESKFSWGRRKKFRFLESAYVRCFNNASYSNKLA